MSVRFTDWVLEGSEDHDKTATESKQLERKILKETLRIPILCKQAGMYKTR